MVKCVLAFVATVIVAASSVVGCSSPSPSPAPTQPTAAPTRTVNEPTKATTVPAKVPTLAPTQVVVQKIDYPQKGKTITLIVPMEPGGTVDTAARILSPVMEKKLGVPIQVVNKPGASTQTGSTELVKSNPDGYTLEFISLTNLITTYLEPERKAIYTRKDFEPIVMYALEAVTVAVQAESPLKTVQDLVDAAKANPGKFKMGTSSLKSLPHLAVVALEKMAGLELTYVHFSGGGPVQTALLGGHVDAAAVTAGAPLAHVKSGNMRLLGLMDSDGNKFYPGVKTFAAQGYKANYGVGFGLVAPAKTPKEIVDLLSGAVKNAMEDPDVKKKTDEVGHSVRYMDAKQFGAHWDEMEGEMRRLLELADKADTK